MDNMKRCFALCLAVLLTLQCGPVTILQAAAAEVQETVQTEEMIPSESMVPVEETTAVPETEAAAAEPITQEAVDSVLTEEIEIMDAITVEIDGFPEPEELFACYVDGLFYGRNEVSFFGELARSELSSQAQGLYDHLKEQIQKIASGEQSSSEFKITYDQLVAWGDTVGYMDNSADVFPAFQEEFQLVNVVNALLHDCPYDLYWYDKVSGITPRISKAVNAAGQYRVNYVVLPFSVVEDLQTETYSATSPTVDTTKTSAAKNAAANAAEIVEAYEEKYDFEKLKGYKDEILELVSYDHSADPSNFSADSDPWQLVYVFDGDVSTNVVCEGYSKAFQYLCDMSQFRETVDCYAVSGDLITSSGSEGHMWNIVNVEGANYLADLTNSDTGTVGQSGSLFLTGGSGSIMEGYTIGTTGFAYDSGTMNLWGTGDDSILKLAEGPYVLCGNGHDEKTVSAVAPTCGAAGLTEGTVCERCGAVTKEQETVPATGLHTYLDNTDTSCETCGFIREVEILDESDLLKDYTYTLETDTITLTGYTGTETAVEVKGTYTLQGVEYHTVLDSASVFQNNTTITSAVLVGDIAFVNNSMSRLFSGCTAMKTVDLSGLNSTGVTDMSYLFTDCASLTSVDVTGLDTSAVTTMYFMFSKCKKLAEIIGYENWDTGSLQVMRQMFNYVQSMETIDLSKWDLSQVINSGWCFQCCNAKQILLPDNLKTISAGFLNHASKVEGTSFTIQAGVEKIGYAHTIYDFATDDFVEFIVAEGNAHYVAIDGILYSADGTEMLAVPRNKTFENNTYEIPEGVTFLGELSFSRNYNIETVVLPNSFVIEYVPLYDPDYILVDDTGNLNTGTNLSIAIYCYTGITQYAVKDDNPNYASQNGIIYSKDLTEVVAVPARYAQKMEIPEGVTTWNREAMWADYDNNATVDNLMADCPGVSIPASLTTIAEDQLTKLNRLNAAFDTFVIEVAEENPAYCLGESGNLVEHSFGDGVVNAPSCTEKGYTTVTCSICGNSYTTEETEAAGHTEETIPAVDATCTETGLTEGKRCTECGEVIVEQETVLATGHSFTSYISNGDATAVLDGTKTAKCDSCDATKTLLDSGSALGTERSLDPLYAELKVRPGQLIPDSFEIAENEIYGYIAGYQLKKGHSLSISDTDYVFSVRKLADENYSTMLKQATTASFTATEDMTVAMLIRKPDKSALTAEELANVVIYDSQYGMIGVEGYAHRFTVEAQTIDGGTATTRAAIFLPDSYSESGDPTRLIVMTNGRHGYLTDSVWNGNSADDVGVMQHYLNNDYAVIIVNNTADKVNGADDWGNPQLVSSYWKAYEYAQRNLNVEEQFALHSRSMGTFAAVRIMRERPELVKCAVMCGPVLSLKSRFGNDPIFMANRYGFDDVTGGTWEADKVVGYDPYTDVNGLEYDLPPTFWMMAEADYTDVNLSVIEKIEAHGNDVTTAYYSDTDHSGVCRLNIEACRTDSLAFLSKYETSTAEHRYGAWKTTKAASCTEGGSMARTCVDCGASESMTLEAIGYHTYDGVSLCPVCGCEVVPIESQITVEKGQFSDTTGAWVDSDIYGCVIAYELKKGHTLSISEENYVFSVRQLVDGNYNTMLKEATTDSFTATEDMTVSIRVRKPDKSVVTAEELAGVTIVDTVYVEKKYETLEGKTISILGASISTYAGISNGAAADTANSTIRSNVAYYPNSTIPEVTLNDTWWMQVAEDLGLRLLVNNSWSGSAILLERSGTVGAYVDRCVQLHDDTGDNAGEEPDIICIQMGFNDFSYGKDTLGDANIDYTTLITADGYGTPATTMEATAIMLDKITKRYPNAEVYMFNHFQRIGQSASDTTLMEQLNASIETVCSRFGVTVVDLYTTLTEPAHIGDGRLHPNCLGMDVITEAVKTAIIGNTDHEVTTHTVAFDLNGVTADYGTDKIVVDGGSFTVKLAAPAGDDLSVIVTMGGKDITADCYYAEDGKVSIDAVTADVEICAKSVHTPKDYRWEFDGTDLVGDNTLTKTAGTTENGVFSTTRYDIATPVVLSHEEPWVVEWKSEGTFQNASGSGARVFTSDKVNANYNARYIFKSNTNGIIAMGEKTTTGSHNYGVALADYGIDWTALHTYRLENRIADDGTNMIYLLVDGTEISPMNHYFVGTTDKDTTSNWLSGKDFVFPYMGTDTHGFNDCAIEYIQVWEGGHTHSYTATKTASTCTEPGYTTYTCACGESYVDSYVDALGHSYVNNVCTTCGKERKTISILGDSISTYVGVSTDTSTNSTIGGSSVYYGAGTLGVYRADTWWQQAADVLGLEVLVNNSWSGSCILPTRSGTVGAYAGRCVQLHNDTTGEEPDVIAVFMGTNDFSYYQDTLGTADAIDYDALITENSNGSFAYAEPATSCEAYAIMLHKMRQRYPDADIYCMTLTARRDPDKADNYADVGQPTAFNAELTKVIQHFDCTVVDLENCGIDKEAEIFDTYMGDGRVHPNAEGMDLITQALVGTMLGEEATVYDVSYDLSNVTGEGAHAALAGEAYGLTLTAEDGFEDLTVTVTMDGQDITASSYADGTVTIPAVTGDVAIAASASVQSRDPLNFRWEFDGTDLVNVSGENALTKLGGTTTDGVLSNTQYQMERSVLLNHDLPWVIEWKCAGDWSGMLLSAKATSGTEGNTFLFRTTSATDFIGFGERSGSSYHNYGIALAELGIDPTSEHSYRMENRIAEDGSNMVYLIVDGAELGPMNNYYIGGTSDQGKTVDWINGKDFVFSYIGANAHAMNNLEIAYLQIWENGVSEETAKPLPLRYDDHYDISDKTVEIVNAGTPTSYQVGYGVAEGTLDTAVVTVEGDHLVATGIGTAKVRIDGQFYEVTVTAAPISLLLLAGQSNMQGSEGNADQSIVCEDGQVYATYGDRYTMTVDNATNYAPSALTGSGSALNVNGTTTNLEDWPVYLLNDAGAGKAGPDSGFAYEWVQQTGEKVWIVNAAHGGSSITTWQDGGDNYEEALLLFSACQKTLAKEIAAGHYTLSHMGYFWCQGCKDYAKTAQWYVEKYLAMHENFKTELAFDHDGDSATEDIVFEFGGIIPVRAGHEYYTSYRQGVYTDTTTAKYHESFKDLRFTGPRVAQYWMTNNPELPDIWNVCNIGESWVTMPDGTDGVAEYFQSHYENGTVDYTTQVTQSESWYTPTTPAAVHDSIHYNQIGYNEVGREAVRNALILLGELEAPETETEVKLISWDGFTEVAEVSASTTGNSATLVVPIVSPVWKSKEISVSVTDGLSYDYYDLLAESGEITGSLTINGNKIVSVVKGNPGELYADHLSQLPEALCSGVNLWSVLEHDAQYFTSGTHWGSHSSGNVYSVTIPIDPGDQIFATSFGKGGENGHASSNGIRVTFFGAYDVCKTMAPSEVYPEFSQNGYLTVPDGATAVNVPMWNDSEENELYILNAEHDYSGLTCTICGAENPAAADYAGKVISILSASTSTFAGYIPVADGFNLEHRARYPQDNLLTDVNETWWMQVINELDAKLGINDSWAGSRVLNTQDTNSGDLGPDAAMASLTRIQNLGANGTPDVILFFGAGNDMGNGVTLGSFDPATAPAEVDLTATKWDSFADAYVAAILRLQYFYPNSRIVAMTTYPMPSYVTQAKLDQYGPVIEAICDHYGIEYLSLEDCGVTFDMLPDGVHPNAEGMDYITDAVLDTLLTQSDVQPGENVVYSVTHDLTNAKADKHYYKGVSAGAAFEEAISGEDLTVTVTMGGEDITASTYANGTISIGNVTGDLVITAKAAFNAEGHLQQLPETYCAGTNLWTALAPENIYYTATGWGNTSAGTTWSITFPVEPGDQIWATSLGAYPENGSTANGVRVTWFDENGLLETVSRDVVYTEFAENGYLTAPEGAVAMNLPMTNNQADYAVYILNAEHSYSSTVTAPTCTEKGYTTHTCSVCGDSYVDSYVDAAGHTAVIAPAIKANSARAGMTEGSYCNACGEVLKAQQEIPAKGYDWMLEDGEFKILLIGNSFSQDASSYGTESQLYNILQAMLGENVKITLGLLYSGGKGVHWHATQAEQGSTKAGFYVITPENQKWASKGGTTTQTALTWADWDVVTLQPYDMNFSTEQESVPYPAETDEKFYPLEAATEYLLDYIDVHAPQADVYCYMHWARSSATSSTLNASMSTYQKFAVFYPKTLDYIGSESGNRYTSIIPVGLSVQNARTTYLSLLSYNSEKGITVNLENDPQIGLQRDGGHLTYNVGRYIAGLTFAEIIIPEEMRDEGYVLPDIRITESVGRLPKEYSEIARKSVKAAVESWQKDSLAVTNIAGYEKDPITTIADAYTVDVACAADLEALKAGISEAVGDQLPEDFVVDAVVLEEGVVLTGAEQTVTATATIRFGYSSRDVGISGAILNEHTYESVVTAPTCTEKGYTTHTCSGCGDSYVDTYVDALGHRFGAWYETVVPTCDSDGEERRDCESCDAFETRTVTCGHDPAYSWDVDGDGVLELLAIGNSFSIDALEYFWQIANDLGIQKIAVGNLYISGCTLKTHAANAASDAAAYAYYYNDNGTWTKTQDYKLSTALTERSWDYISMQQSSRNSGLESTYNEDLTNLISYVKDLTSKKENENRNPCAKLVWHMTWAYQQDSTNTGFANYNNDQMTMYNGIVSAVQNKIAANNAFDLIVPNGTAVQNSRTSLLGDTTTRDGYHMTKDYGRYLTGLLFVKTVTGLSVDGITYAPTGVDAQEKTIAIESVNNAYTNPFEVTKSAYTGEAPEEGYILLQSEFYKGAFWDSTSATGYNELFYDRSISQKYFATIRFTRETLPVGSIIILADGWRYRPDGWITDTVQTGLREPMTTESYVVVTEEWWGDYTIRGFNVCRVDGGSVMDLTEDEMRDIFRIYVPRESHVHTNISVVTAPTCTEQGYTTYTCTLCGDSYVDSEVPVTGHSFGNWEITIEATCTEKGEERRDCANCDHNETREIAAKGHTEVIDKAMEATCTKPGLTEGKHCSVCNTVLVKQNEIPATGHSYGAWSETKAATCTEKGEERRDCANCDHYETREIAAKGHTEVLDEAVDATCTEPGQTEGKHCSVCDEVLVEQEVVPALGHSYGSVVTDPTCGESGYTTHTCAACDDSYVDGETEPTGEHTYRDGKDADCEVCGQVRDVKVETTPMYRMYNPNSGEHFYTGSIEERDMLVDVGWNYEGIAWNAPIYEGDPVHRVYNPNSGDHHYTMSQDEVDMLVGYGWQYEGVAWNSGGDVAQQRLYNPNADCGSHHYTSSQEELDFLVSIGWIHEGIGWFGMLN